MSTCWLSGNQSSMRRAQIRRAIIHPRRRSRKGRDDGFGIRESRWGHRSGIGDVGRVGRVSYIRRLFAYDCTLADSGRGCKAIAKLLKRLIVAALTAGNREAKERGNSCKDEYLRDEVRC